MIPQGIVGLGGNMIILDPLSDNTSYQIAQNIHNNRAYQNEQQWSVLECIFFIVTRHTVTVGAYMTYSTNELHPNMYNWSSPQLHGLQAYKRLKSITPQEQIVSIILQVGYMKWLCRYHQLWRWLTTGATSAHKLFRKFTYKFCVYFTTQGQPANSGHETTFKNSK